MMLKRKTHQLGLAVSLMVGMSMIGTTLFGHAAYGQDAAWEGLINAGRNALQQQKFLEAERHFEAALEAAEQFRRAMPAAANPTITWPRSITPRKTIPAPGL